MIAYIISAVLYSLTATAIFSIMSSDIDFVKEKSADITTTRKFIVSIMWLPVIMITIWDTSINGDSTDT